LNSAHFALNYQPVWEFGAFCALSPYD